MAYPLPTLINVTLSIPDLFSFEDYVPVVSAELRRIAGVFNEAKPWLNSAMQHSAGVLYNDVPLEHSLPAMMQRVRDIQPLDARLYTQLALAEVALLVNKIAQERAQHNQQADVTLTLKLDHLIGSLEGMQHKSDELWWYLACAVEFRIIQVETVTRRCFSVLLQAIESVPSVGHKKGIHYWILKHGGKASLFTLADTQRLDAVFPGVPWRHTPLATLSRHEFVLRSLLNKNYFEQINSYMGPIVDPKNLYVEMTFSDASKHRVNFTKQDLLVYAAHIYAPAPPILELDVPGVKGLVAENVNIEFNKNLRRIGHCNARGHLRPSFFKAKKMTIRTQVLNALESCKVITSNEMRVEYSTKLMHWDHMTFEPQYKSRLKVMDELSGFSACNNLHFFFEFLVATHYGLQEGARVTIRDTIKQCLYYADQAKRILKGKTAIRKMHKDLFVLAKRFITDFVTSKCTRIINVGTPIAPGKTHSEHSIYVVFKFIEPNHVKIIISNGGLGVNQFHRPATAGVERDHEEYDYAAFETLTLTAANQDMLSHYVYRILQIRFMTATDKPGQGKGNGSNRDGNTFDDIVRDIYLRTRQEKEPSYFRGYQFKKFSLQRDDLPQSLLAQFTGNCTLHNLKKALQIGYDMDDTIFGKLEDNLLVGFDQKVTQWGMQLL